MKVLFLTGEYPPLQGGIADYTANLNHSLIPLGVEPAVLTTRRWLEAQLSVANNQSPHLSSSPRQSANPSASPRTTLPPLQSFGFAQDNSSTLPIFQSSNLPILHPSIHPILPNWGFRCWPAITKFLRQYRPQILHVQYQAANFDLGGWVNWLPWYLQKRKIPVKIVTTFHDLRIPYIFPKAGPFRWQSILALARYSHAVICTNREDTLAMSNEQLTINNLQRSNLQSPILHPSTLPPFQSFDFAQDMPSALPLLTTIPLGSNIEPQPPPGFERSSWRAKFGLNSDTFLLVYFGFLNASKGGEELIEALALLRQGGLDAQLLLVGGDIGHADPTNVTYAQKVEALIAQHGLQDAVYRTGYVEAPEVSASFLAADAVVMPYRDGVSFRRTTLIAALRHGCPMISTRPADPRLIPEIKPGENMLLAPPADAAALAQTIASLAENRALQQKLSKGARQLSELFNWEQIAAQTIRVYQSLLAPG